MNVPESDTQSPFSYAGATADITPVTPVPLAGWGREQAFHSVFSRLEANAVVLGCNGTRVLFISADLLFFGAQLVDSLQRRGRQFGLTSEQVVLTASHTHFAPATDQTKPLLGAVDANYMIEVEQRLLKLVDTVMSATLASVSLQLSRVDSDLNVNRRRRRFLPTLTREGVKMRPSVVMAPDVDKPRDGATQVLRVVDAAGAVVAVLWKFACHPVCYPDTTSVCAEYPGHARSQLRSLLANNVPVVFWQGFAGDLRPRLAGARTPMQRLSALRGGPGFGQVSYAHWSAWVDRVAKTLVRGVSEVDSTTVSGSLFAAAIDLPLSSLIEPQQSPQWRDRALRIHRIVFGGQLEVWFVGAEVCAPYLQLVGADRWTICVGYAGDVFGYLPSQQQAEEGGYEGREFFASFGLRGALLPGFERAVAEAVARLRSVNPRADHSKSSSIG